MRRRALMALLVAILVGLTGCNAKAMESAQRQECERALLGRLKTPSTYKRISADDLMIESTKPHYFMVAIEYDAANSYNAPIRDKEYCSFRLDAKGKPTLEQFDPYAGEAEKLEAMADGAVDAALDDPPPAPKTPVASDDADEGPMDDITEADAAAADKLVAASSRYPGKCYKDYCPCEAPQGGADQLICDQLEEGIEVEVQTMISGRAMKEARRQLQELDY